MRKIMMATAAMLVLSGVSMADDLDRQAAELVRRRERYLDIEQRAAAIEAAQAAERRRIAKLTPEQRIAELKGELAVRDARAEQIAKDKAERDKIKAEISKREAIKARARARTGGIVNAAKQPAPRVTVPSSFGK